MNEYTQYVIGYYLFPWKKHNKIFGCLPSFVFLWLFDPWRRSLCLSSSFEPERPIYGHLCPVILTHWFPVSYHISSQPARTSSADKHCSRLVSVVKYTPADLPPRFCNDLECIGVPQQTPRECFIHYVSVIFFYTLHRVNNSHQGAIDPFLSLTYWCTGWIWFNMMNWWRIRCC